MSEIVSTTDVPVTGKYYGGTVTANGRDLITSLIAGQTIEFTRVIVGSGQIPEGVEPIDMTDLVNPIAEATSSVPIFKKQIVSMLVEYRNDMNGGLKQSFWLREFGIYAKSEDTEEILLYYATLGDSPQPVNAYRENRIDVRRYPVVIEVFVDAVLKLGYIPGAFVTSAEVQAMVDAMVRKAIAAMGTTVIPDFVIPVDGWENNTEPDESEGLHVDIPQDTIRADMVPDLTILPVCMDTAQDCGMSNVIQTLDGALRVYAQRAPAAEIRASLTLICTSGGSGGSVGSGYVLPTATADRLGGVKVGPGLNVDSDGTLSVDTASEDEVNEMLTEAFAPDDK